MIEFDHVSRIYGDKLAVADLSLSIPAGEIFALLGPNGAGKTTSIKMMVGLLHPTNGHVRICGHDVVLKPREAIGRLGFVPDEPYLYEKLSGREILSFVADMHGLDRRESAERIRREVANFQLESFLNDRTETYSHGMKQRLAFAAALLHDPAALVIDEPMIGLDPRTVRLVKDLLRKKSAGGMILFLSTHSLAMAEEIADRIGVLDRGRMRFLGTLAQLREQLDQEQTSLEELYLRLTATNEMVENNGSAGPTERTTDERAASAVAKT
jgi:ABC-2 type transport system ATP-binding protein